MKGILIKDWFVLKKMSLMMLAVSIIWSMLGASGNLFFGFFAIYYLSMFPNYAMSFDEKCGWQKLEGAMPCTRSEIVISKYILGDVCVAFGLAITAVAQLALPLLTGASPNFTYTGVVILGGISVGLLSQAFYLPFCFAFGQTKGKFIVFLTLGVAIGIISAISFPVFGNRTDSIGISTVMLVPFMISAASSFVLHIISMFISVKIYQHKDL